MGLEIERKYLVINDKWRDHIVSESAMIQGYLANMPSASVRVRVSGDEARLTIKGRSKGICRSEYEYPIPLSDAQEILDHHVSGALIEKVRYQVRCGDHIWDLDVFEGANRGLIMAEVELGSEDESFRMPEWAGEEVSADNRYYNASLATHPYCDW
jgi:adenylate cyclase